MIRKNEITFAHLFFLEILVNLMKNYNMRFSDNSCQILGFHDIYDHKFSLFLIIFRKKQAKRKNNNYSLFWVGIRTTLFLPLFAAYASCHPTIDIYIDSVWVEDYFRTPFCGAVLPLARDNSPWAQKTQLFLAFFRYFWSNFWPKSWLKSNFQTSYHKNYFCKRREIKFRIQPRGFKSS